MMVTVVSVASLGFELGTGGEGGSRIAHNANIKR